ncbi:unnamed protein product [Sympodiomycopsis kandeliae]
MVKETKFYDLLGVAPGAGESELKKAYRKKALQAHPDKGGDPEVFKEITSAYEALADPQKRDLYDRFGEAGLSESGGMGGGMDPSDLFSQLFGGAGGGSFFGGGGGGRPRGPRKGKDLVHRVKVTLEELYAGKVTKLALQKNVLCKGCDGKGGKNVTQCRSCNGQGVKMQLRQLGPMIQQVQSPCEVCSGVGETMSPKDKCKTCNGRKVNSERKVLEVRIEKGMEDGQQITFKEEADQAPNTVPGDVVIVVDVKPHERFQRKGNDLYTDYEVDLLTALGGGKILIQHLDDRALSIEIPQGDVIKPETTKVLRGHGFPSRRFHEPGDLYVRLTVAFPENIDPQVISLLEQALPARRALPKFDSKIHIEEAELDDMDEREARKTRSNGQAGGGMGMDVDEDDDETGGGPNVQCAQS